MRTIQNNKHVNYTGRNGQNSSREPERQNFDRLDSFHDFTSLKIINQYRKLGDEVMGRNFWK